MSHEEAGTGVHPWTIGSILQWTQRFLADRDFQSPRLDAEVLLAHVLGRNRVYLYTHYDLPLQPNEAAHFGKLVRRRARHEPVAYLLGEREFFGRPFLVNPAVLIPRPETEHVVEVALSYATARAWAAPRILDVGCGSGVLALTLALELQAASVVATDICEAALAVARHNAHKHDLQTRVECLQADLFPANLPPYDLIVANLPYVAHDDVLPVDVRSFEPHQALFSGPDGLEAISAFCRDVARHLRPGGAVVLEIGHTQEAAVTQLLRASEAFVHIQTTLDLQQHPRVIHATRRV